MGCELKHPSLSIDRPIELLTQLEMTSPTEPSSLSFVSSSHVSNSSVGNNFSSSSSSEAGGNQEIASLNKLSSSLEQLFVHSNGDYSDADILVEGITVGVHRCILAARSMFFNSKFKKNLASEAGGKPKYDIKDLLPYGKVGYEALSIILSYLYTGKLRPLPTEVSTCVNTVCAHDACRPAIDFVVELMYASSVFQLPELVSVFQRRLGNLVEKSIVENVLPILMAAFQCEATQLVDQCVDRVARSDLDYVSIEKELPFEISEKIKLLRKSYPPTDEDICQIDMDSLREKRIRSIHKALDSDDVELVKLLLIESDISLNDAYALHYAVLYCDLKVVSEVLSLESADVNLQNSRGYTVLHVAAMRKEPLIIISLLEKGADASQLTRDGRSAVNICRALTRPKDYQAKVEKGKENSKARICIDVLDREMRRNTSVLNASEGAHSPPDDLHFKLIYLENRVAFARLFFPTEAKVAMDIANVETTTEFAGLSTKVSSGNSREVDLNETPAVQVKRLSSRIEALMKTVETGRRYFPHCSEVLDKFMDDDLPDMIYLETGTLDEQRIKRKRYRELKEDVQKAFTKDTAGKRSCLSSSSSSSFKYGLNNGLKRLS